MRRYIHLLLFGTLFAFAVFWLASFSYVAFSQDELPDLIPHNVSVCKTWEGYLDSYPGRYFASYMVTFYVKNDSPVPAVARSGYGFIRNVAFVGAPFWTTSPGIYTRIEANQIVGPWVWHTTKPSDNWQTVSIVVDDSVLGPPAAVIESNEDNNRRVIRFLPRDLLWCPGYGPAQVLGYVFIDKNGNGRKEPNEPGIKNAIVQLWQGRILRARVRTSWPTGSFSLKPSFPGTYSLTAIVPSDRGDGSIYWTTPKAYYGIDLSGGGTRGPFYFGIRPAPPSPPQVYYSSPSLRIEVTPRYPVVVGQDPNRRGADVSVVVTSPPALFEWYEWDDAQGKYVKRQEKVPVPVVPGSVELYGDMTTASQDWVRLDLSSRYPGADVRKVSWDMGKDVGLRVVENRTLADGTTVLRATAFRVPFADPGTYTLRASAKVRSVSHPTTGLTVPQRTVHGSGTVQVYVKDSTLR